MPGKGQLPGLRTLWRRWIPGDWAEVWWRRRVIFAECIGPLVCRMHIGSGAGCFCGRSGVSG